MNNAYGMVMICTQHCVIYLHPFVDDGEQVGKVWRKTFAKSLVGTFRWNILVEKFLFGYLRKRFCLYGLKRYRVKKR